MSGSRQHPDFHLSVSRVETRLELRLRALRGRAKNVIMTPYHEKDRDVNRLRINRRKHKRRERIDLTKSEGLLSLLVSGDDIRIGHGTEIEFRPLAWNGREVTLRQILRGKARVKLRRINESRKFR